MPAARHNYHSDHHLPAYHSSLYTHLHSPTPLSPSHSAMPKAVQTVIAPSLQPELVEMKVGVGMNLQGQGDDKPKRKRQSQSCDACRARKVRCAREGGASDDSPVPSTTNANGSAVANTPCKHCLALNIPCTYDYQPKKRGPPNLYLRRLQEQQAQAAVAASGGHQLQSFGNGNGNGNGNGFASSSSPPMTIANSLSPQSPSKVPPPPPASAPALPAWNPTPSPTVSTHQLSLDIPPSRYPIAADVPSASASSFGFDSVAGPSGSSPTGSSVYTNTPSVSARTSLPPANGSARSTTFPLPNLPSYPLYNLPPNSSPVSPPTSATSAQPGQILLPLYPALDYHFTRTHRIEDIAPRVQILHILSLFFEFVYPLTPCVHKPSFLADLASRREERDSLFFALVMSTVASTLVQVPRACLPMSRHEVRRLAQSCHEASRHITVAKYDPPMSIMVVIRYFDTVYHFCEGHDATSHASFGEAQHIAVTLHMHEESSYAACDPIETEVRRRVFWLLFDADKSMSVLLGRPICLRDEDCTVHFPKEVDDDYITLAGVQPQPPGKTAVISGLNYISRIFALLGEILVRIRVDKRSPPTGLLAEARLEEIRNLHTRIVSALSHAPPPLRLGRTGAHAQSPSGSEDYNGAGFRKATYTELREFFDNPDASRTNASDPFLVMQGNLYVTQQLVRFVIEQYRDELMMALATAVGDQSAVETLIAKQAQDQEAVASDLLHVLHSIPIQAIATNGPSLVHKVRFVASTLLDTVRKVETDRASAARAHAYLWDFLSILSEIERNYLLDDDPDSMSGTESVGM